MHFDDVFDEIGHFGKYQKILYFAVCAPICFAAFSYMAPVFILAIPKHRCAISGLLNDTYEIQNELHEKLVQSVIPIADEKYSKCDLYDYNLNLTELLDVIENNKTLPNSSAVSCSKWVYDKSVFQTTVVTETNIVCSRTIYHAHAITATDIGGLIGPLLLGSLSDRFGRKLSYMLSIVFVGASTLLMLWLPHIWVFITFRFILGFHMIFTTTFVYIMEFVGPSRRMACGMFSNNVWAIGLFIQAGLAYGLRNWRHLQLAMSVPIVPFLLYWRILPESPRWLFSKQKMDEGKEVVQRMARVNGVTVNVEKLEDLDTADEDDGPSRNFFDLFRSRNLLARSVIVVLNWLVVNMMFYGLSLNVGNLSGDIYWNFFYSALMEFAAIVICIPLIYKLGRKLFHCSCMVIGGVVLLLTPLPLFYGTASTAWTITMLAMLGKFLSAGAYATIYLYTSELFPTVVRNTVVALGVFFACVGGIAAPYLVELANLLEGKIATVLPMVVFGVCSLFVGLLALCLPDTSNMQLPDTIGDIIAFRKAEDKEQKERTEKNFSTAL